MQDCFGVSDWKIATAIDRSEVALGASSRGNVVKIVLEGSGEEGEDEGKEDRSEDACVSFTFALFSMNANESCCGA